jgi:hypothetical protein
MEIDARLDLFGLVGESNALVGDGSPPTKGRMRVENLQAAHQQYHYAEQIDPVGQTGRQSLPVNRNLARMQQRPSRVCFAKLRHKRSSVYFRSIREESAARFEFQGDAIHAVAQTGRGRAIVKDVAKMAAAAPAMHLGAFHPQTPVDVRAHRAFDRTPETRPSSGAAVEFGLRLEKQQGAVGANKDTPAMLVEKGLLKARSVASCRRLDTNRE